MSSIEKAGVEKAGTREAELLDVCYTLSNQIDQELKKPLTEQNYDEIRKKLKTIRNNENAGKAATYAKILTERIERYELAISVVNTLKEQEQSLEQKKEQIQKAHKTTLKELPKEPDYIFTGILKPSHVYTEKTGQQRHLVLDPGGNPVLRRCRFGGCRRPIEKLDRNACRRSGNRFQRQKRVENADLCFTSRTASIIRSGLYIDIKAPV